MPAGPAGEIPGLVNRTVSRRPIRDPRIHHILPGYDSKLI